MAVDESEFTTASRELLGDEVTGEAGLLAGLGLRPEALGGWRGHVLNQLLEAQMQSDPAGLLADLQSGRWQEALPEDRRKSLLGDAGEALARRQSEDAIRHSRTRGGKALELSQSIEAGRAGLSDIRQAEEAGSLSTSQAEALRGEATQAEIALQALQVAGDQLAVSLSSGVGFDLGNPQNRQAADSFYETIYSQSVRAGASQEVLSQVVSMAGKTGYLSPRLARDTTGLLQGSDSARLIAGAELYAGLRDAVPEVVALAFDPETRARGGVLKRWLDMGLEPVEALQRAEAEWPDDGRVQIHDADELEVLKRDLSTLFNGTQSERHVERILAQLERNYLDDLGKGLTPRQARHQYQRDVGRVMRRLTLLRDAAGEASDGSDAGRSPLLIPTSAKSEAFKQTFRGSAGQGSTKPRDWWLGPSGNPLDDELANAAGLELERVAEDFAEWMVESYITITNTWREFNARTFPDAAASRSKDAMVSIGDGGNYLGKIIPEDGEKGARSVAFQYPGFGVLIVRQHYDAAKQRFENLYVSFEDPETGEEITETLPSSRFILQSRFAGGDAEADTRVGAANVTGPDETTASRDHARVVPSNEHRSTFLPGRPSEPVPVIQLPPSEAGPGRDLTPNHTGGSQTELGPPTELTPGFPAQEREPLIHITPDQREELLAYQALLQANASDDDEVKLPAGVTEADLKPAKQGRDQSVMSSKGDVWAAKSDMTALENLDKHYDDHSKDFDFVTNPVEYALAARKFLESPPEGVQAKIRENGDILLYDPISHTFAVRDVNGVPRTFFKPDPPNQYWDEQ